MAHGVDMGFTIWFTGLSGAGKTTLGKMLFNELEKRGLKAEFMDGDLVRRDLCRDLGFSVEDRIKNIERVVYVAKLLNRHGISVVSSFITPYRGMRNLCRENIERFAELYVSCPLEVLIERDTKGLYRRALAGEIKNFTGLDDPFEEPENPDLVICTNLEVPEVSLSKVINMLEVKGFL
ncbi:MAG: adenylyl-sulfate kinase [Desulfocucumaceae bacterium]